MNTRAMIDLGVGAVTGVVITLIVIALISTDGKATPLDLLQYENESHKVISLEGLTPTTAWKIAETNEPLKAWKPMDMADLGHFISDRIREIKQETSPANIPTELINFTKTNVPITQSIDEVPGNDDVEPINTEDGGLLYL